MQLYNISKIKWSSSDTDEQQSALKFWKDVFFLFGAKWAVEMLTRYSDSIHYILLA